MKAIIVLMLFVMVAATSAISLVDLLKHEWNAFKLQHRKSYQNETEENFRMKIFAETKHKVAMHNQRYERGEVTYKLGINKFADLMNHEFSDMMNGFNRTGLHTRRNARYQYIREATFITPKHVSLPESIDWRTEGAVTPVKDQGQCGSCWAFSSTGALEGQIFRKNKVLVSLSEQNLVDCSSDYGNHGCSGGLMGYAYDYIKQNKGIDTGDSYSYEHVQGACRYDPENKGGDLVSYTRIPDGDENALLEAVATVGPVAVTIDASQHSFQIYKSGVYNDPNCLKKTNHAVLAVGYGTSAEGGDYWLVKNSWGPTWGDEGYIKVARNKDNACGIAHYAMYPNV